MSGRNSEPSASKSPILSIDWRSGSVVMQLGPDRWHATVLPEAERTKLSCSSWTGLLEKLPSDASSQP